MFIENKGQITDNKAKARPEVLLNVEGSGTKPSFNRNGISYQFIKDLIVKEHKTNFTDIMVGENCFRLLFT